MPDNEKEWRRLIFERIGKLEESVEELTKTMAVTCEKLNSIASKKKPVFWNVIYLIVGFGMGAGPKAAKEILPIFTSFFGG